eukprot:UN01279
MTQRRFKQSTTTSKPLARETSEEIKNTIPLIEKVPLKRSQSFPNLSVNFADGYAFWLYYLCIVFICWYWLFLFPSLQFWPSFTIINIIHAIVTFYLMHWRRGTVDSFDQGRDDKYTFWEMLDEGKQYTPARKFFTVVPIALFLIACYEHEWRKRYYFANVVALILSVVPKMPFLMYVRLLGINR